MLWSGKHDCYVRERCTGGYTVDIVHNYVPMVVGIGGLVPWLCERGRWGGDIMVSVVWAKTPSQTLKLYTWFIYTLKK